MIESPTKLEEMHTEMNSKMLDLGMPKKMSRGSMLEDMRNSMLEDMRNMDKSRQSFKPGLGEGIPNMLCDGDCHK